MLDYMGIYKTLKTIETLALHERVLKLVTVVLYIPIQGRSHENMSGQVTSMQWYRIHENSVLLHSGV